MYALLPQRRASVLRPLLRSLGGGGEGEEKARGYWRSNVGIVQLQLQQLRYHGSGGAGAGGNKGKEVKFSFILRDGSKRVVSGGLGENLLRVAQRFDCELEGACECSVACSTCHVILQPKIYEKLEQAEEKEEDMLDMAFGLTETSRLGCQVKVSKDMEGMEVTVPKATRNFYVDGHVPKPH